VRAGRSRDPDLEVLATELRRHGEDLSLYAGFLLSTAVRPIRPDHVVPAPQLVLGLER
jgi:hypothetical protein